MIIQGTGRPVVLLHGVTSSCHAWQDVIPFLSKDYKVYAFTALGHNGAKAPQGRIELSDVIDDMTRTFDKHHLSQPYIVGNSMGAWIAIELAKRGRASGVCAISPAGIWHVAKSEQTLALKQIKYLSRLATVSLPFISFLSQFKTVRKFALKKVAEHGDNLSPAQFKQAVVDMCRCTVKKDILNTQQSLSAGKLDCPITLVWPDKDKLFPIDSTAILAQQMFPNAAFIKLANLGHVPMIDDPKQIANVIKASMTT